jgi:hypothetical protein
MNGNLSVALQDIPRFPDSDTTFGGYATEIDAKD